MVRIRLVVTLRDDHIHQLFTQIHVRGFQRAVRQLTEVAEPAVPSNATPEICVA